ncbi:hypothetical protein JW935_08635, partial [candidate division KSB1 bacterium]|nr:hypothetical protein [candidate division KSB1 bacterium]
SVMIYAYEVSGMIRIKTQKPTSQPTDAAYLKLKQYVAVILDRLGMANRLPLRNRILERLTVLNEKDTHLIQSIVKALSDHLDQSNSGENK